MERGDIATWDSPRLAVVLEGILAQVPPPEVPREGLLRRKGEPEWAPAEQWGWSVHAVKVLNHKALTTALQIDVVTFLAPEVGDSAAEWLLRYECRNATCEYVDFDQFCTSLQWRPDLHSVVDSDQGRLARYGIRAYETTWGGVY